MITKIPAFSVDIDGTSRQSNSVRQPDTITQVFPPMWVRDQSSLLRQQTLRICRVRWRAKGRVCRNEFGSVRIGNLLLPRKL